eukprot:COSAG01_NODE_31675_length_593_cov_0.923077_1_plen_110_part_01
MVDLYVDWHHQLHVSFVVRELDCYISPRAAITAHIDGGSREVTVALVLLVTRRVAVEALAVIAFEGLGVDLHASRCTCVRRVLHPDGQHRILAGLRGRTSAIETHDPAVV